jgi:hypothetical protein
VTEPPFERGARQTTSPVARKPDRWRAAMLFSDHAQALHMGIAAAPREEVRAWTSEGALQLAEVLPERFGEVRVAIVKRFAPA